jgi:hypothetical protein
MARFVVCGSVYAESHAVILGTPAAWILFLN